MPGRSYAPRPTRGLGRASGSRGGGAAAPRCRRRSPPNPVSSGLPRLNPGRARARCRPRGRGVVRVDRALVGRGRGAVPRRGHFPGESPGSGRVIRVLYQGALIMTHRDRAGDASGQGAGRREAAGDAGHRRGFPTPAHSATAGSPARPERRLPKAFGPPITCRWGAGLPMARIAPPRAPRRKPWEAVSMGHYQRSLV